MGFPGLSKPLQQALGGTGRGRGLSGWEAVGTEQPQGEPGRQDSRTSGLGEGAKYSCRRFRPARHGPEGPDGKFRPQGTGSLAGKVLAEGSRPREELADAPWSRRGH